MVDSVQQPIIARLFVQPQLGLALWALAEPERAPEIERERGRWAVRSHDSPLGVILTVHDRTALALHEAQTPASASEAPAEYVLVFDALTEPDPERLYAWPEVLAVARYYYEAAGRLFAVSDDDTVLAWAHELFTREPNLRPLLIGAALLARTGDALPESA